MARLVPVRRLRAVLGIEETPERLDAAHDHQQVVAAESEHRVDEIVTRALITQMHLQPISEEGEQIDISLFDLAGLPSSTSPRALTIFFI